MGELGPLSGDPVEAVTALRKVPGPDLVILGSGELVRTLWPAELIDEIIVLVHPLTLGTGQRLFPTESTRVDLELIEAVPPAPGGSL